MRTYNRVQIRWKASTGRVRAPLPAKAAARRPSGARSALRLQKNPDWIRHLLTIGVGLPAGSVRLLSNPLQAAVAAVLTDTPARTIITRSPSGPGAPPCQEGTSCCPTAANHS